MTFDLDAVRTRLAALGDFVGAQPWVAGRWAYGYEGDDDEDVWPIYEATGEYPILGVYTTDTTLRDFILATPTDLAAACDEIERLRAALTTIKNTYGQVCDGYELCTHRACASSYGAWATADEALNQTDTEEVTP